MSPNRNYEVGDCHVLAAVLNKATGWPVAIFDGAGAHVAVVIPDGRYLDVTGPRDGQSIRDQWMADEPLITDDLWGQGWDAYPEICDWLVAKEVLDRAGLLDENLKEIIDWEIDDLRD
jgi:hypothetical protein